MITSYQPLTLAHPPMGESGLRVALVLALLALDGCRCGSVINPVDLGFRASATSIDFGRVLEGAVATRSITLTAETRAKVTVTLALDAVPPFGAPVIIEVPGGGQVELPVSFTAGSTEATGTLTLSVNDKSVTVSLHGIGVRPPVCIPSAACRTSTYSLDEDRCIEAPAPDNAACDTGSLCLEQGRCRSGVCLGVARTCDDTNECTIDGCAMASGCVHTPRACPPPTQPCHVTTCDARTGCGEGLAQDGAPCGTIDCTSAHLCFAGVCREVPTPEGFQCSAPIACLARGECRSQRCVRPDAGDWQPSWSARLQVTPSTERPVMLSANGNLFFTACGLAPAATDAGLDAGGDAGVDAGVDGGEDGGEDGGQDSGADAGDGGGVDGGPDASVGDGGVCGLVSYTSSGFDRFLVPFDDGEARRLLSVGTRGVLLLADAGLELRSRVSGAVVDSVGVFGLEPGMVSSSSDGTLVLSVPGDAGSSQLYTWSDAGVSWLATPGLDAPLVAVDEAGDIHLWARSGALARVLVGDGGLRLELLSLDGGLASLALARGAISAGLGQLVTWGSGGGARVLPLDWSAPDGGLREPLTREVMLSPDTLVVFFRQCANAMMSCLDVDKETWARAVDSMTGALRWESQVLPAGVGAELVEAALVDFTPLAQGSVATVVRADFDAGSRAYMQVFGGGQRLLLCPLPWVSSDVRGALFSGGQLLVVVARPDAGMALEAYSISGLPMQSTGWPQADAVAGERRALR